MCYHWLDKDSPKQPDQLDLASYSTMYGIFVIKVRIA